MSEIESKPTEVVDPKPNNEAKLKEKLKAQKEKSLEVLKKNNASLMHGTPFDEHYFKGMPASEVNNFLVNYKGLKAKEPESEPSHPNTPILGTPVGSGAPQREIDRYISINPESHNGRGSIEFSAPASVAFAKHKNQTEALNKWLDLQ